MPTIGSRRMPCGAGISRMSPTVEPLQLARSCPTPLAPEPSAVRAYTSSSASPAIGSTCTVSAMLPMSVATIITGVFRKTTRALRTVWTRVMPGVARSSPSISGGKRSVRITMSCDGATNRSGIERRVHPVDDRLVAGARHAGKGDDERERQHQRGDAGRRPARRLDQAVGRERALDRPDALQQRPDRARQRQRQQRSEQQHGEDRERVADVEDRPGLADQRGSRSTGPRTAPRSRHGSGSRRPTAPDTCPSAAPGPGRRAPPARRESARRRCSSRRRCRARAPAAPDWSRSRRPAARRRRRRSAACRSTPQCRAR